MLRKYGGVTAEALVESAFGHVALLNKFDLTTFVFRSNVPVCRLQYEPISFFTSGRSYPLHLGVTEAGTPKQGVVKSAMGIGGLLCLGIGDTFRVTLTADPVEEIGVAKDILKGCGAAPGRGQSDCLSHLRPHKNRFDPHCRRVERRLADCGKTLTVAVMGCVVNGPGEAAAADVGIAGGNGEGLVFRKGEVLRKVPQEKLVDALMEEIERL